MSRKIKVLLTKSYYMSSEVEIEIPDNIQEGDEYEYLQNLDTKTAQLTDAVANGTLNPDGDGIDIDII